MPFYKNTSFLSEIKTFFKDSDVTVMAFSFKISLLIQKCCYFIGSIS